MCAFKKESSFIYINLNQIYRHCHLTTELKLNLWSFQYYKTSPFLISITSLRTQSRDSISFALFVGRPFRTYIIIKIVPIKGCAPLSYTSHFWIFSANFDQCLQKHISLIYQKWSKFSNLVNLCTTLNVIPSYISLQICLAPGQLHGSKECKEDKFPSLEKI